MNNSLENWCVVRHRIECDLKSIRECVIPFHTELVAFLIKYKYEKFSIFNTPDKDIEKHRNDLTHLYMKEMNLHKQLFLINQQIFLHKQSLAR